MEGTLNEEQPLPLAFHIVKGPPKTSEFRHASLTTHLTAHVNRSSSGTASLFFNYCRPAWDLQHRDLTFGKRILEAAVLELERRVGMEELSKVDDDRWSKRQRIYGRSKNWSLSFRIHVIIALKSFRSGGVPSPSTFCAPEFEREVIFWRRKRVFLCFFLLCSNNYSFLFGSRRKVTTWFEHLMLFSSVPRRICSANFSAELVKLR